jgi:hypothetical protein
VWISRFFLRVVTWPFLALLLGFLKGDFEDVVKNVVSRW